MKKIILTLAIVGASVLSYAQTQYKPTTGSITTELNFTPFRLNGNMFNIDEGASVRYFLSDKMAVRLNLGIQHSTNKNDSKPGDITQTTKDASNLFMLRPGIEYHFAGSERLSPYVGANIGVGFGKDKQHVKNLGYVDGDYSKSKSPFMTLGIGVVAGMDFYIYQGFYLGTEFGLGYDWQRSGVVKTETKIGGNTNKNTDKSNINKISNFGFSPNLAIRLGWRF